MKIEIWSDIVCPFCYIGKRRIENALKNHPHADKIEVEWKSFLLNPEMVSDPTKKNVEYLAEIKGWSLEQAKQITQQVVDMAAQEGLEYNMDQAMVANPKDAHRVIQYAKTQGLGDAMKERSLKAYFTEGKNISDFETITTLAVETGLDADKVKEVLESGEYAEKVQHDIYESQQLGVRGVPFFVLDGKYGISGAQHPDVFKDTLDKAWANYAKENSPLEMVNSDAKDACDIDGEC
ncbi:DsbA family oxidoreductase [Fulvivirga sp.]|uniref:DsbA family oxidoreductase n=1 Tax=Fulvivirga sp. TaxID=1931237 RepID=UPI0032EAD329